MPDQMSAERGLGGGDVVGKSRSTVASLSKKFPGRFGRQAMTPWKKMWWGHFVGPLHHERGLSRSAQPRGCVQRRLRRSRPGLFRCHNLQRDPCAITVLEALDIGPATPGCRSLVRPGRRCDSSDEYNADARSSPTFTNTWVYHLQHSRPLSPRTKDNCSTWTAPCPLHDIDVFLNNRGVLIIEDAAEAHGVEWKHRARTGSSWRIAASSSPKCGPQGGCAECVDELKSEVLRQKDETGPLRMVETILPYVMNELEIDETSVLQVNGRTDRRSSRYRGCHALERAAHTGRGIDHRIANFDYLASLLDEIPGVRPTEALPEVTRRPTYQYAIRIDGRLCGAVIEGIIVAFTAETGLAAERADPPLNRTLLYRPHTKRRFLLPGKSVEG